MISDIMPPHYSKFLELNAEFVHWLSPLNEDELITLLGKCSYVKTIDNGAGFMIGYDGNSAYRHKNVDYLSPLLPSYGYVDRVIIDAKAQGKGYAKRLYRDFENWCRAQEFEAIGCEVNTLPDNPGSHKFHQRLGFQALGEVDYPQYGKSLRYYMKRI